jgi:peptidoglycan/xylan/chitin deacetylase (PgdA/CDA1 family)
MLKKKLRLSVSLAFFAWDRVLGFLNRIGLVSLPGTCVVLYYHEVTAADRGLFAAQLDLLCDRAVPVSALNSQALKAGELYVAVTVDDAFVSFCQNGLPELVKRKMPVVVFVPTAYLGRKVGWGMEEVMASPDEQIITTAELQDLAKNPLVQIGSHTANHRNLTLLDDTEAMKELSDSKQFLEQTLDCPVNSISFPYGAFSSRHLQMAANLGYTSCFSTSPVCITEKIATGLVGRVRVDPYDSILEFKLKSAGAYRWQVAVGKIKRMFSSVPTAV